MPVKENNQENTGADSPPAGFTGILPVLLQQQVFLLPDASAPAFVMVILIDVHRIPQGDFPGISFHFPVPVQVYRFPEQALPLFPGIPESLIQQDIFSEDILPAVSHDPEVFVCIDVPAEGAFLLAYIFHIRHRLPPSL